MKTIKFNGKDYKVSNEGTYYHVDAPNTVILQLEEVRKRNQRIRIFYGDVSTGRPWNETFDVVGYVGRTTGIVKAPILLHNQRSMGGGLISGNNIVAIKITGKNGQWLYKHPNFHFPKMEVVESVLELNGRTHNVMIEGKVFSRHPSEIAAKKMVKNLTS